MELIDYVDQGGIIVYILIALNIIGFTIMIVKFIQIFIIKRRTNRFVKDALLSIEKEDIPLHSQESTIEMIKDEVGKRLVVTESGLATVKIIASISPLLGLLGTVMGVLFAFDAISKGGLGDPSIFAGGISMALITTIAGLIVAIPHYIGYNYLLGMLDSLEVALHSEIRPIFYKRDNR
jgi:biopolymer transport protein ExbB